MRGGSIAMKWGRGKSFLPFSYDTTVPVGGISRPWTGLMPMCMSDVPRSCEPSCVFIERMTEMCLPWLAHTFMCSENFMFGPPVVSMALNSPPFFEPGFGSHVSIWVGPPPIHSMMTALAVLPDAWAAWVACARSLRGIDAAATPAPAPRLNLRKLRRLNPGTHLSQCIILFPSNFLSLFKVLSIYSTQAGLMARDEFGRIEERPVRVLPAAAAVPLDEAGEALLLAVRRRPREGGQEHEVDL